MEPYKDKELLSKTYKELGSCEKVAKRFGCNPKTVLVWLKKLDIKINAQYKDSNKKHFYNEDYFEKIDSPEKAYWLGFIYADGCVYKGASPNSYRLQINLKASDIDMLQKFQECIGSKYKIAEKEVRGYKAVLLKINSTKMCNDLMILGVLPRKSLTLEPPVSLSHNLRSHFIRGYFDGDGSFKYIAKKEGQIRVQFIGTKKMVEWIHSELLGQGIPIISKIRSERSFWALEIQDIKMVNQIGDYIYKDATIKLKRKHDRFTTHRLLSSLAKKVDTLE